MICLERDFTSQVLRVESYWSCVKSEILLVMCLERDSSGGVLRARIYLSCVSYWSCVKS